MLAGLEVAETPPLAQMTCRRGAAELVVEGIEAVVPVVIAGDGEDVAAGGGMLPSGPAGGSGSASS